MNGDYKELFKNPFFSALASYGVLATIGLVYPSGWIFLFSIFLSYVLSDLVLNCFIRGGKGWSKIFGQNDFACKGHSYLAFFVGIVVGTILSAWWTDVLMKYLQSQMSWVEAVLITDILVVVAVLGDLLWRFY